MGKRDVPKFALDVPMEIDNLHVLFSRVRELTGHKEFVVIGSNSVLGAPHDGELPERMITSIDIDAYAKADPGRMLELNKQLGAESDFAAERGFYLDPVTPAVATLPDGWESRLYKVQFAPDITVHFLDPNDAAVSKYARCEPRDREWIRAGMAAGVLSPAIIEYRMRETHFLDNDERNAAQQALAEDRAPATPSSRPRIT